MTEENKRCTRKMNDLVRCECGWPGDRSELFHRSDCGEGWHCDQHECPQCTAVIGDQRGKLEPLVRCGRCDGDGYVLEKVAIALGGGMSEDDEFFKCPDCGGKGTKPNSGNNVKGEPNG